MNMKEVVGNLITNGEWEEEDREFLMSLNENQLTKIMPVENASPAAGSDGEALPKSQEEGTLVENAAAETTVPPVTPTSAVEFLAAAPPEIQEVLNEAMQTQAQKKVELIQAITANTKNIFTNEQLAALKVNELTAVAALAKVDTPIPNTNVLNFSGMAPVGNVEGDEEEALELPVMNFAKTS